jgi:hypothetical protein
MTRQGEAWSDRLRALVKERASARSEVGRVERAIAREASRARDAGATVEEIAGVLGMSRQAVYALVKRAQEGKGR